MIKLAIINILTLYVTKRVMKLYCKGNFERIEIKMNAKNIIDS